MSGADPLADFKQIALLPKQMAFVDCEAKYPAYFGGIGNGKTLAGCVKALLLSEIFPGNLGLIMRQNYPDLRDTTMKSFFDLKPALKQYYFAGEMKLVMPNGSEILFRHAENLKLGHNLGFAFIDQGEEVGEEVFLSIIGRLRRENIPVRQCFLTGNPAGHNFIYKRWKMHKDVNPADYVLFEGATGDNPYLPDGYLQSLLDSYPEEWIKRYVYGSWDAFEGLIWSDFSEKKHVIEDYTPSDGQVLFRSIDFGYRNPTCCLFATEDFDGNLIIYDEHYQSGWTIQEHASAIKEKSKSKGDDQEFMVTYIDPSCFNRTREKDGQLISVADEFADFGIICQRANNDVAAGVNRVAEYFKSGRVKISSRCKNLIWEIQDYKWKEMTLSAMQRREAPEAPRKVNDHACDALRYLVMSRSWHIPPSEWYANSETQDVASRGSSGYGI